MPTATEKSVVPGVRNSLPMTLNFTMTGTSAYVNREKRACATHVCGVVCGTLRAPEFSTPPKNKITLKKQALYLMITGFGGEDDDHRWHFCAQN